MTYELITNYARIDNWQYSIAFDAARDCLWDFREGYNISEVQHGCRMDAPIEIPYGAVSYPYGYGTIPREGM